MLHPSIQHQTFVDNYSQNMTDVSCLSLMHQQFCQGTVGLIAAYQRGPELQIPSQIPSYHSFPCLIQFGQQSAGKIYYCFSVVKNTVVLIRVQKVKGRENCFAECLKPNRFLLHFTSLCMTENQLYLFKVELFKDAAPKRKLLAKLYIVHEWSYISYMKPCATSNQDALEEGKIPSLLWHIFSSWRSSKPISQ